MPASNKLALRPLIETRPVVGSVIRLRIFSNVDMPAPLRPMMLTTSPCLISKETSLSAQKSSDCGLRIAKKRFGALGDDVAKRGVTLPLLLMLDAVFFAQIFDADDYVRHKSLI